MTMPNPYDPSNGMYVNLRQRMVQNFKAAGVEGTILEVIQTAYEETLKKENIQTRNRDLQKLFYRFFKTYK